MDNQSVTAVTSAAAYRSGRTGTTGSSGDFADSLSGATASGSSSASASTTSSFLSGDTLSSIMSLVQQAMSSSGGSSNIHSMTISQIRDVTDQLAVEGKLSLHQQMRLIESGLMDLNPTDPSYQPETSIGYSRSDTGTYDFAAMTEGYAGFDDAHGLTDQAASWRDVEETVADFLTGIDDQKTDG